jgi:hypothetical protein
MYVEGGGCVRVCVRARAVFFLSEMEMEEQPSMRDEWTCFTKEAVLRELCSQTVSILL